MVTGDEVLTWFDGVDRGTVNRGRGYARGGRVRSVEVDEDESTLTISGIVDGTRQYHCYIDAARSGDDLRVVSSCTCPLGGACKHVVATAIVFDAQQRAGGPRAQWRRVLDEVLDEAPPPITPEPRPRVPVAVQIVLPPARPPSRYAVTVTSRPRLNVRAVRQGTTRRWVKTGMGWSEIGYAAYAPRLTGPVDPADIELLNELKIALVSRRGYLMASNEPLDLHEATPSVWRTLARLAEQDIPLVCSDPSVTVRLADSPARVEIDLAGTDDTVTVSSGVTVEGTWYAPGDLAFIGEPPHGVALWTGSPGRPGSEIVLARLESAPTRAVRHWLATGSSLTVDRAGADELLEGYLPRLARSMPVRSRNGTVELPGEADLRLRCDLTWDAEGTVTLDWRWIYQRSSGSQQFPVDDPSGGQGWRDRVAEIAFIERLGLDPELATLLSVDDRGPGTLAARRRFRDVDAMRFAEVHQPVLEAHPDIDLATNGAPPTFREATGVPEIRFVTRGDAERKNRTDWLDLDVVISVADEQFGVMTLDLPRVLAALTSGHTVIMVRPGVHIDVDRPELDQLARLVEDAQALTDQPPSGLRLNRQSHALLADVHEIGPTEGQLVEWATASAGLRRLVEEGTPPRPAPPPVGLDAVLRPYQQDGYQWLDFLRRSGLGGILADDMGLGKTVQALAMIARAHEDRPVRAPFLVVAPSSVVGTWEGEAARFTPGLRVAAVTGSTSRRGWPLAAVVDGPEPADIVVTTYTLLRLEIDQYAAITWAGLILDEAQAVKNHQSKTHAALRELEADCRFAITGTPIENNLMELWSILSLTAPGLFPYAESFRNEIAQPIEQKADGEALARLRRRIKPVMLRRTKDLVAADLPEKTEQVVTIELSPRHRKIYDTHLQRERQRILKLLGDLDENRITILASLTRLRQLALDPALIDRDHEAVGSAKIDELVDRLVEIIAEGHRALVFSQFTTFLSRVRDRLAAASIETAYLDGRTRRRAQVIAGFRTGTAPVFLISLKAGGVGLTLTEADYCFLLDPWWNPAVETQAIDRTHRIGQTRPVMVYRLVSAGTIEEKVIELAARKADLYRSVLDSDGQLSTALTADDIAALIER